MAVMDNMGAACAALNVLRAASHLAPQNADGLVDILLSEHLAELPMLDSLAACLLEVVARAKARTRGQERASHVSWSHRLAESVRLMLQFIPAFGHMEESRSCIACPSRARARHGTAYNNLIQASIDNQQDGQDVFPSSAEMGSKSPRPSPPIKTTCPASEPSPSSHPLALGPAVGPSQRAVLSSPELLEVMLQCLAGPGREARGDLGHASAVCRLWRDVSCHADVWGRVACDLLPLLQGRGGCGASRRRCLAEYGRCVRERVVWVGDEWEEGLRLHFEVWDEADGQRLLSAEGALRVVPFEDLGLTSLRLEADDRVEVVGPPLRADKNLDGMIDMEDFLANAHQVGAFTALGLFLLSR
jgi:hypothetical protein